MDRPLDDVISERQLGGKDGKLTSSSDWVHDRFEDDNDTRRPQRNRRPERNARLSPPELLDNGGQQVYKIRVDNLHYDIPEDDLRELFERIGPVLDCWLLYDRSDRSRGVGFVTYAHISDARLALREYDGANAKGQPIRLTLMPSSQPKPARGNPFDTAQRPGRSLFDRIEPRDRSLSPQRERGGRHSDVSKPAPSNIDRYVPGQGGSRSRSPLPRRGGRESGRRPGARRDGGGRGGRRDDGGRPNAQGRPRKTADELDAEMEDYWGAKNEGAAANGNVDETGPTGGAHENPGQAATSTLDDDIDMAVE
ncbi:RNA-binding domain-containing protein [Saccharata proteae CBS 121410]|uniref:RNA-binding domain-containing protein n=1 Tax=Saccharata proteae CBS 121410 TaxID=1314787 RepID=A0A9P4HPF6_9PEZI|nr:RNA-binding domain-containing protein [Saccharata proteae CBS 121410]